jgi:hypothetical protein
MSMQTKRLWGEGMRMDRNILPTTMYGRKVIK